MSRVSGRRLSRKFLVLTAKLRRNSAGVAAVEFGLIAPMLIFMLIGTIELSRAISIDRKFSLVTSTIADLVSRERSLTAADVTAMYGVVDHMMKPWSSSTLKIKIIPVKSNLVGGRTCAYAQTANRPAFHGASQVAYAATYAVTANLMAAGTAVIVVESSYAFTPLFVGTIIGTQTWTDKAILSPREGHVQFDTPDVFATTNCP